VKIGLVGLSYKSGVADVRESSALEFLKLVEKQGIEIVWHDPLVQSFENKTSTNLRELCGQSNLVVLTDPSIELPLDEFDSEKLVIDCTYTLNQTQSVIWL
jgi:UDP-N-acetyl-D-mannosaminuronate dehydrogenase